MTTICRSLAPADAPATHEMLSLAFSDYVVPVSLPRDRFDEMMRRRGVDWSRSCGAFAGDRMVGATLVATGPFGGSPLGYVVSAGVVPEFRRQGLAERMMEDIRTRLRGEGIERMQLEVLVNNDRAVRVWTRLGFRPQRDFYCYQVSPQDHVARADRDGVEIRGSSELPADGWPGLASWQPSWQNSLASLRRASPAPLCLEAWVGGECRGALALFPHQGDIAGLAVHPAHRRRGLGSMLLRRALQEKHDSIDRLTVLNLDGASAADLAFWRSQGAVEYVRQKEMLARIGS